MPEQTPENEEELRHKVERLERKQKDSEDREAALSHQLGRANGEISLSGLTRPEAREFNKFFLVSFIIFTVIAIIAHWLVWLWRPWLQQGVPTSQTSMMDIFHPVVSLLG